MKPQGYLTETGKGIFKELVKHCKEIMPIDSFRLSELAQAIDMVQRTEYQINYPDKKDQKDGVQTTSNGYTQVTGYVTVRDKYSKTIDTLGAKFGLTPADREKIKAFAEKKEDKPSLT